MDTMIWPTTPVDATLTQEGEAADSKVTGEALAKKANSTDVNDALATKCPVLIETNVTQNSDTNGNVYTNFSSSEYVIVEVWAQDAIASLFLTGSYMFAMHLSDFNGNSIGAKNNVTVWYRYYKR